MDSSISSKDWISVLKREYLTSFISQGGAAVKFAVPASDAVNAKLMADIRKSADELGYQTAVIQAASVRTHLMDQVFCHTAALTPWPELTQAVVLRLLAENGYVTTLSGTERPLDQLSRLNGLEPKALLTEARKILSANVYVRPDLAKDFRIAMLQLCLAYLTGGPASDATNKAITEWLTGKNPAISAVKPYSIFSRVTRANARYHFESLIRWIKLAGKTGTVLVVDISQVALARNNRDGSVYYTKAAFLDAMEVFRQFIDATDRMSAFLLIAVTDATFLDDDNPRSVHAYSALKARVFDEVRDRRIPNPMSSLVRISANR